MHTKLFLSVLVTCYLLSINAHSEHPVKTENFEAHDFLYALNNELPGYFYATTTEEPESTKWEVTLELLSGAFNKTCERSYNSPKASPGKKFLKPWKEDRVLLIDFYNSSLKINQIEITTCIFYGFSIYNVDTFQVYTSNDNEFDILYTTFYDEFKDYIVRVTYDVNGLKSKNKIFVRRPNPLSGSDNWKALLLGNSSYHYERRVENGKISQVIAQVQQDPYNMTDLMKIGNDGPEKFLTSNQHGKLGACYVLLERFFICSWYDQGTTPKFTLILDHKSLKHPINNPAKTEMFMYNLEGGAAMILFVEEYDNKTSNGRSVRSFTPIFINPTGHYNDSVKVEFKNSNLMCSRKNLEVTYPISPDVNVVEIDNAFCFQFICSHYLVGADGPSLKYEEECVSKESFGLKPKPNPEANGVEAVFNKSILFLFFTAFLVIMFVF